MKRTLIKYVLALLTIFIVLCSCPDKAHGFQDPWYYEMQSEFGVSPMPDKYAHFLRSFAMANVLPGTVVFGLDLLYEVYDGRRGVGFSYRDLIADGLGTLAGTFNTETVYMYMTWAKTQKTLTLNVTLKF